MTGKVERIDMAATAQQADAAEEDSLVKDPTSQAIDKISKDFFTVNAREDAKGEAEKSSLLSLDLKGGKLLPGKYAITLQHILGEGSFGIMYHGILKRNSDQKGIEVAVKTNKVKSGNLKRNLVSLNGLQNEILLLKRIAEADKEDTYPFARFIASIELEIGKVCLIQKLCDCTLKIAIATGLISTAQVITDVAKQLLNGKCSPTSFVGR